MSQICTHVPVVIPAAAFELITSQIFTGTASTSRTCARAHSRPVLSRTGAGCVYSTGGNKGPHDYCEVDEEQDIKARYPRRAFEDGEQREVELLLVGVRQRLLEQLHQRLVRRRPVQVFQIQPRHPHVQLLPLLPVQVQIQVQIRIKNSSPGRCSHRTLSILDQYVLHTSRAFC